MKASSWRQPPFLVAAPMILAAVVLWLRPSDLGWVPWSLAALGAVHLLCGVGELVERRVRPVLVAIPPDQQRLLVAVSWRGDVPILLYHGNDAHAELDNTSAEYLYDLGLDYPDGAGLHVWEGIVRSPPIDDGDGYEPDWIGTWRRATAEEARRYAAGEPVWRSE